MFTSMKFGTDVDKDNPISVFEGVKAGDHWGEAILEKTQIGHQSLFEFVITS